MSRPTQSAYERGFITRIEIKDKEGRVKGAQEVITYRGLLNLAHDDGLLSIKTVLVQIPAPENEMTAIVQAEVQTAKGTFTAIGDANPENVNVRVRRAIIRMAETRAKARAFRDAVNIGVVSLEELGQEIDDDAASRAGSATEQAERQGPGAADPGSDLPMTDNQRRYIFRLLSEDGLKQEEMGPHLKQLLGVDSLKELTRKQASGLIEYLTRESHERTQISSSDRLPQRA